MNIVSGFSFIKRLSTRCGFDLLKNTTIGNEFSSIGDYGLFQLLFTRLFQKKWQIEQI